VSLSVNRRRACEGALLRLNEVLLVAVGFPEKLGCFTNEVWEAAIAADDKTSEFPV